MASHFSKETRNKWLNQIEDTSYDLIVIGGGVTGAGILLDATTRGLKVLLVEMQDFAAGTSSRSTKLIHGGIRYIKQGDFKIVTETGKERKVVRDNARHLVTPIPVLIPIYKGGSMKKWQLRIGMWIFEWLVRVQDKFLSKFYNKKETLKREPHLNPTDLKGAVKYFENRTDDARLTLEVIKTAIRKGAKALNYARVNEFIFDEKGVISGIKFEDQINKNTKTVSAKIVVSATGPWVDDIREIDDLSAPQKLVLTKGVHLVFPKEKLPVNHAVYFDTQDKRMVFAVPAGDVTYLGTTDTFYKGDAQNPDVTDEDINYLIATVNHKFPSLNLTKNDVVSTWSGLRPLINEEGKSPSEISRKDEIFISKSGLISIAGGKLTGYRKMAEKVVNQVCDKLGMSNKCATESIRLVGNEVLSEQDFLKLKNKGISIAQEKGISLDEYEWLFSKYGIETLELLKYEPKHLQLPLFLDLSLQYSLLNEMVVKPEDYLTRRSSFAFFDPDKKSQYQEVITKYVNEN